MSDVDTLLMGSAGQEVPRDRWGRPLITPPGGGKPVGYTRTTRFVSVLEDTYNLGRWEMRQVAIGLADRPDLLLAAGAHRGEKKELDAICEQAKEAAKASAAATTGTALHKLAERLDRGEDLGHVPEAYRADLAAYQRVTAPLVHHNIETFGVVDGLRVGGTWDRVSELAGRRYIADLKTGRIDYGIGKIAMQLAVYSRSVAYDHASGVRTPLEVDQDRALVIHLPAGAGVCELHWVDIAAGWAAVQLAVQVQAWRKRKGLSTPVALGVDIPALIAAAGSAQALGDIWKAHKGEWTPELTALAAARKAEIQPAA